MRSLKDELLDLSQELANRHLLSEAGEQSPTSKRVKWIAFRLVPSILVITLLMLHFLS